MPFEKTCIYCDSPFQAIGRNTWMSLYCSPICKKYAARERRKKKETLKHCKFCDRIFLLGKTGQAQMYCSPECRENGWKKNAVLLTCVECKKDYLIQRYKSDGRQYCSNRCVGINFQRNNPPPPPVLFPKICPQCNVPFVASASQKDAIYCSKPCYFTKKATRVYTDDGRKICSTCKEPKTLGKFYPDPRGKYRPDKTTARCKKCCNHINGNLAKSRVGDPAFQRQRKATMLKREYGLLMTEYENMLELQNQRCAICRELFDGKARKPVVDHCHKTGDVRGLLCLICNTGLGMFRDHAQNLVNAATYLDR